MEFIDIHTHNDDADNKSAILNCTTYTAGRNISIGIHPWKISNDWEKNFASIKENATKSNVIAIGECGIDKVNAITDIETQKEVFRAHAILAEKTKKPLIIHCVKGFDEILAIHKEIGPKQAWIIHGFRGKPQQAKQFTKAGLYLSFGIKFNIESLKATPAERVLIESDESPTDIHNIYRHIADTKGCSLEEMLQHIQRNIEKCNIRL